jgi:hypothetical protein
MMNRLVRVKLWTQRLESLMLPTTGSTELYTAIRNALWQRRQKAVEGSPSQWRTEGYITGLEAADERRRRQGRMVCIVKNVMRSMIEGHASRGTRMVPGKSSPTSRRRTVGRCLRGEQLERGES